MASGAMGMSGAGTREYADQKRMLTDARVAADRAGNEASIEDMLAMLGISQGRFNPIAESGLGMMPTVQQAGTVQGMDARLGEIFGSNAFASLQDQRMRAVQNQLNQTGMRRSDAGLQAVAGVPTELGFALEEALYGRQSDMLGMGYQAASDISGLENSVTANIANIRAGHAANAMNERIANQQASAARRQNNMNTAVSALGMAAMFFSDPRFKTNIQKIGQIKEIGLYSWDWIDGVPDWMGRMKTGVLTTEVKEHYPQHVYSIHGIDAVDYASLAEELRAAA